MHAKILVALAAPEQPQGVSSYAKLHQSVIISSTLSGISERLQLPVLVPRAVDHAIAEIIFPTVERSVTIGRMTTIELINKVISKPTAKADSYPPPVQWHDVCMHPKIGTAPRLTGILARLGLYHLL